MSGDFTGRGPRAGDDQRACDVEITVGPFAKGASYITPERQPPKHFKQASGPLAPGGTNMPAQADPVPMAGGTGPIMGSDIGSLPGPVLDAQAPAAGAPGAGKKGPAPAPDARAVAKSIITALRGRKAAPARVKSDPMPAAPSPPQASQDQSQPAHLQPDRVEMPRKTAAMAAIGLPAHMVAAGSIVDLAVTAKLAALDAMPQPDDHAAAYIARDDVHPMALWTMLSDRYGQDWLDWDAEVVKTTLVADVGREPRDSVMNKIAAMQLLFRSPDQFYGDWHVFEKLCLAFDSQAPRLTLIEELTPEQMAMGVSTARMITPGAFDEGLCRYCAARLFDAGMLAAPPELGFCDEALVAMTDAGQADTRQAGLELYSAALSGKEAMTSDTEAPEFIQAARMLRVHAYVLDKIDDLMRQSQ